MTQPANLRDAALKDIEGARTGVPEGLLHRAQARALLHLADRIDVLIELITGKSMTQEQMRAALARWKEEQGISE